LRKQRRIDPEVIGRRREQSTANIKPKINLDEIWEIKRNPDCYEVNYSFYPIKIPLIRRRYQLELITENFSEAMKLRRKIQEIGFKAKVIFFWEYERENRVYGVYAQPGYKKYITFDLVCDDTKTKMLKFSEGEG